MIMDEENGNGQSGVSPASAEPVKSNAELAEGLYGNPGGSLTFGSEPLAAVFDPVERELRGNKAPKAALEVGEARRALTASMQELAFSPGSAQDLSILMVEYRDRPREEPQMQKNLDEALETLANEWGDDFSAKFDGAKKVLATLTKGHPALAGFVHGSGLSMDVRLLRLAGEIAWHRKAIGK